MEKDKKRFLKHRVTTKATTVNSQTLRGNFRWLIRSSPSVHTNDPRSVWLFTQYEINFSSIVAYNTWYLHALTPKYVSLLPVLSPSVHFLIPFFLYWYSTSSLRSWTIPRTCGQNAQEEVQDSHTATATDWVPHCTKWHLYRHFSCCNSRSYYIPWWVPNQIDHQRHHPSRHDPTWLRQIVNQSECCSGAQSAHCQPWMDRELPLKSV